MFKKLFATLIVMIASMLIDTCNVQAVNRIHFLPTGGTDAILLESNGKFALVDGGEDTDNPRKLSDLNLQGFEKEVVAYIKKVAGDKKGNVTLEFIVGTHAHSDHLGGLDTVIKDKQIKVKKAYIKRYDETKIREYEVKNWDNKEVYEQTIKALKEEKAQMVQDISHQPFKLGELTIQFFNEGYDNNKNLDENDNSLGVKVSKGNQTVFLAGDINNVSGDEDRLAKEIGKVDVLKLGHHGLEGSSTQNFLNTLNPKYAIATNSGSNVSASVLTRLNEINCKTYPTVDNNGVVLTFGQDDFCLSQYTPISTGTVDSVGTWELVGITWYYKDENGQYVTGWKQIEYKGELDWYYFNEKGEMQRGFIEYNGNKYFLREYSDDKGFDGAMVTGWFNYNGAWYYFNDDGEMYKGWLWHNNNWYYLDDKDGKMLTGTHVLEWKGEYSTYTFNEDGALIE